jgi:hypothetical protein
VSNKFFISYENIILAAWLSTCFSMLVHCIQVLEGVIKYRWNALPAEQRDGMKNFISDIIVQVSAVFGESSYMS